YDYWSDTVRPSILLDSKADLVVYGMGEENIVDVAKRLRDGRTVKDCRDLRGVAYALGASETAPAGPDVVEVPSFEAVKADKDQSLKAAPALHREPTPFNAKPVAPRHARRGVGAPPPRLPLSEERMDFYYGLPFTRRAHPSYKDPVPAWEMIKDSVTIMRGC